MLFRALDRERVNVTYPGEQSIRMVAHRHIDSSDLDEALSRVYNAVKHLK